MSESTEDSPLIKWTGRLAIFCLALVPLSVLAVRLGLHFSIGLPLFALSGVLALLTIMVLVIAALLPRYRTQRRQALLGTLPAIPPVVLILAVLGSAGEYPRIHDITTDTSDPPLFDAGVMYRGPESNPVDIKPDVIAIQQKHYPDLASIETTLTSEEAFEHASMVAESLGWEIYNSDPSKGIIEAAYTSLWFGFVDDIVIRVRDTGSGSTVDLRSVSRVGLGDLGANANRIRAFSERFEG